MSTTFQLSEKKLIKTLQVMQMMTLTKTKLERVIDHKAKPLVFYHDGIFPFPFFK